MEEGRTVEGELQFPDWQGGIKDVRERWREIVSHMAHQNISP